MSAAMFTDHAVEHMRQRDFTQIDLADLLKTVERMADNPAELRHSKDVVRVGRQQGEETFIVRSGDMRAIIAIDPAKPEKVFVLSVYRADISEQDKMSLHSVEQATKL
jgi:hypothetical protein